MCGWLVGFQKKKLVVITFWVNLFSIIFFFFGNFKIHTKIMLRFHLIYSSPEKCLFAFFYFETLMRCELFGSMLAVAVAQLNDFC